MKPWGPLIWLLKKLPLQHAAPIRILAGAAAEERCLGIPQIAGSRGENILTLVNVIDPPSRFTVRINEKVQTHLEAIQKQRSHPVEVIDAGLFANDETIA